MSLQTRLLVVECVHKSISKLAWSFQLALRGRWLAGNPRFRKLVSSVVRTAIVGTLDFYHVSYEHMICEGMACDVECVKGWQRKEGLFPFRQNPSFQPCGMLYIASRLMRMAAILLTDKV